MVRLKADEESVIVQLEQGFNSTMVRLKDFGLSVSS